MSAENAEQAEIDGIDLSSISKEENEKLRKKAAERSDADAFDGRGGYDASSVEDADYELSDNVAEDLIKYVRSNTIKNEQQFLVVALSYLTGYFEDNSNFVCGVLIGTSSSGKSHLQGKVENLFPDDHMYMATTGTEKSLIYDGSWNDSYIASMDELQKPGETLIEFLKSVHGDDEQFEYKVTAGDAQDGKDRDVDTIIREAKPYWFLYAQYEPDFEMWNRLLKVPVYESETKNRAVGAMKFDHEHLSLGEDDDVEYNYDFEEGEKALQKHVLDVCREAPKHAVLPTGGPEYSWDVWDVFEPIFQHKRSESNRIYSMVNNLVRASAMLNYKNRETKQIKVDGEWVQAVVAEPQDAANILACRDALMSTTHELDRKKKVILTALETKGGTSNEANIKQIQEYIRESDSVEVKRTEMQHILDDLADNYLIYKHERAGDNNEHIYEFLGWGELRHARILDYPDHFKNCTNPITGQDFIEFHKEQKESLEANAADFMNGAESEVTSGGGQKTLGGGSSGRDVDLTEYEENVRQHVYDALNGEHVTGLDNIPLEKFLGLVDLDDEVENFDPDGTILDPDHDVWYQPDKPDDWIVTEREARREVERSIRKLISERVILAPNKETEKGEIKEAEITVLSENDL